jgi:hypothetical protein
MSNTSEQVYMDILSMYDHARDSSAQNWFLSRLEAELQVPNLDSLKDKSRTVLSRAFAIAVGIPPAL